MGSEGPAPGSAPGPQARPPSIVNPTSYLDQKVHPGKQVASQQEDVFYRPALKVKVPFVEEMGDGKKPNIFYTDTWNTSWFDLRGRLWTQGS